MSRFVVKVCRGGVGWVVMRPAAGMTLARGGGGFAGERRKALEAAAAPPHQSADPRGLPRVT